MISITPLAPYTDTILLIVRVIAGVTMIYYGWPKIIGLSTNADDFVNMGFKPGWLWGTIVAVVEFVGGIALIVGAYVGIVAALFGFEMVLGALRKITKTNKPFTDWSYDLLLLSIMLLLLITGAGTYTLF